jgi:hypothetical protein
LMGPRGIAAMGLGVLVMSGCSQIGAGQAAVSDEFRVSQADVDAEVRLVLEAIGQPAGQPPQGLARATAQRLVQDALAQAKADELGIEVTQGQVEAGAAALAEQNGGQEALEQAALQAGIAPESIEGFVRTSLLFQEIGMELDPGADAQVQATATGVALAEYAEQIDLRVASRYGAWDPASLAIVPGSAVAGPSATVEP